MRTKIAQGAVQNVRRTVDRNVIPRMKRDVQAFLQRQQAEIARRVRESDHPQNAGSWWDQRKWDAELRKVLAPYAVTIARLTAEQVRNLLT